MRVDPSLKIGLIPRAWVSSYPVLSDTVCRPKADISNGKIRCKLHFWEERFGRRPPFLGLLADSMQPLRHPSRRWARGTIASIAAGLCLALTIPAQAQAPGRIKRTVADTERGGYFSYPYGNQWDRLGADFGRTNLSFGLMSGPSVKGLHGRLQHFAPVDDGNGLSYFPWAEFQAYDADEMRQGRPSLLCSGVYQGKKRPLYFSYGSFDSRYPFQPMNVRDERFIKFWIKNYARNILSTTYYQNWWVGADNGTFRKANYGVFDDSGRYVQDVPWDSPYPQTESDWITANIYMLRRIKELSPNISVATNDIGLRDDLAYRMAEFLPYLDGVIRETLWYHEDGGSDWWRTDFYNAMSEDYYRGTLGKMEIFEAQLEPYDSARIRRSYLAYLIFGGENFFLALKDSSSRELDPGLWADMRNRVGKPTGGWQSTQESGRSPGHRLYWRECEGGIAYLNWTGAYKTASLPGGRTYYDRFGNQVSSISLGDMDADYVQFSPVARVSWPSINPRYSGPVAGPVAVKLDIDPAFGTGETIRYTTDGSDPTASSPTYSGSLTLYSSATVKARAFKSGLLDSFVNAAAYTVVGTPAVEFHLASDSGSEFLKNDFPLVALSHASASTVQVSYSVSGGSASAGSDYTSVSGTLTFPPGERYRFFKLPINNDSSAENNETVQVSLSSPSGAFIGGKSTYTYTINDNDGGGSGGGGGSTPAPDPTPVPDPTPTPTTPGTVDFGKLAGSYGGLIEPLSLSFAQSGCLNLSVTSSRSFSGKVVVGGVTKAMSGTVGTNGFYQGTIPGTAYTLELQIDPANSAGKMAGALKQSGSKLANVTAHRRPAYTTSNPCPRAGNYTVILPADPSQPQSSYPQGTGFGLITVSVTGSVWVIGALGDQTSISAGGNISANGEVPFYSTGYGGKGGIAGWFTLLSSSASNQVTGTWNWFKPATSTTMYPNAFTGRTTLVGSGYVQRTPVLPSSSGYGRFNIEDGATNPSSDVVYLLVGASNTVKPTGSGNPFTFSYDSAKGFFSGYLYDFKKSYFYRGAVLQKQNYGAGLFTGNNVTGNVRFEPY
jgi:Calx-beta domain/Chitobiase/beta-hexosaminidase C-terminal domain